MEALAALQEVARRSGVSGNVAEAMAEAVRLIGDGILEVETGLVAARDGAPPGVEAATVDILAAGGKRIRPALCLLAYRAAGGSGGMPIRLATSCELLHNATLLHDDVIDEGDLRRGRPAARVVHGNAVAVLAGDYLLMRTVESLYDLGPELMSLFVATLRRLVEGEVIQLGKRGATDTSEAEYFGIVEGKTASLFRFATEAAALLAGADPAIRGRLGDLGWHVGVAFQIVDDILDLDGDGAHLGKSLLTDIREGKMTLPVILARQEAPGVADDLARIAAGDLARAVRLTQVVRETGALDRARSVAARHTRLALDALDGLDLPGPAAEAKDVLRALCSSLVSRGC